MFDLSFLFLNDFFEFGAEFFRGCIHVEFFEILKIDFFNSRTGAHKVVVPLDIPSNKWYHTSVE